MTPTHAPGHIWQRTRCLPNPLPRYLWIDVDDTLWIAIPVQQVVAAHVALFIAGVTLVDAWQRRQPRGVIVGDLRQLVLPLKAA